MPCVALPQPCIPGIQTSAGMLTYSRHCPPVLLMRICLLLPACACIRSFEVMQAIAV